MTNDESMRRGCRLGSRRGLGVRAPGIGPTNRFAPKNGADSIHAPGTPDSRLVAQVLACLDHPEPFVE